jgi:ribosome-binding ATPase YchF (GTP1/OBG family)
LRRRREKISKELKGGDKHALAESHVLDKLEAHLNTGKPAVALSLAKEEWELARFCFLLTAKPTLFAANVKESELAEADRHPHVARVREYARTHHACDTVVVAAQLESDLGDLAPEEGRQYLQELGVPESGMAGLIRQTYALLGLRTFFTFNEKEVRAWTVRTGDTASRAAGTIHTDIEKGFIKAERISWEGLVANGSVAHARETGHYSHEGRDYVVRDGDVLLFRFHS